jgi:outer membrane protein TolC
MRGLLCASFCLAAALLLAGCTANQYRKQADKAAYRIIQEKQKAALGRTNEFSIETPYSKRKPKDIKAQEIIEDRSRGEKRVLSLPEALRIAYESAREYQLEKEAVFLRALTLSTERFTYIPQFTAGTTVTGTRDPNVEPSLRVANEVSMANALKTGGRISLDLANSFLRFYSGGGRNDRENSAISLSLIQPLLRGAGAKIAAERLTQAERNVIYEVRSFDYFQHTFAFNILSTYLGLVQQQDTVRNQYTNYVNRVTLRERSEALAFDRLARFQADLTVQEELAARNSYILAVQRYRETLDDFKVRLGLPLGDEIQLDENVLREMEAIGLVPAPFTEEAGFKVALDHRLDLLNEIDQFEDSKRKIDVAKDFVKPELTLFGNASLDTRGVTDYAKFNLNDYHLDGGARIDLPINKRVERNNFRSSIISFEVQLRRLAQFLDNLKNDVRSDLRSVDQARQSYEIQVKARELADRRVESADLNLQAGRIQIRDVVDAQAAKVLAYNAATAALVQYHLARLRLLLDLGILNSAQEKFWLKAGEIPKTGENVTPAPPATSNELITPDELFQNDKRK